jgi:hypothetical protein
MPEDFVDISCHKMADSGENAITLGSGYGFGMLKEF